MNQIEVTFSAGTVVRWAVPDDDTDTIGVVEQALVDILGQPDAIQT